MRREAGCNRQNLKGVVAIKLVAAPRYHFYAAALLTTLRYTRLRRNATPEGAARYLQGERYLRHHFDSTSCTTSVQAKC
jgi:hypothetical protein